jgi:hypothetical protein
MITENEAGKRQVAKRRLSHAAVRLLADDRAAIKEADDAMSQVEHGC